MLTGADRPAELLTRRLLELYPGEAARALDRLPPARVGELLREESLPRAVAVLERLTPDSGSAVLEQLGPSIRRILPAMDPGRAAALLARMDEGARKRSLGEIEPRIASELRRLLVHRPDSAGALMDPRVTAFHAGTTARQALARVRSRADRRIYDVFLIDGDGKMTGTVALQDLALAPSEARLESLVRRDPVSVAATATREEIVDLLGSRRLASIPVVDFEGRLLGVIRHEALLSAAQAEASVDIQTMVGASREERALSNVSFAVRKRLPWLQINLATAFLAASVVSLFESIIAKFTALAVLLPVVAGQSGNTGAQALAVTMRGLALREIHTRQWLRLASKEVKVAVINGIAVAVVTSAGVFLWSRSWGLTLVIGVSMIISMAAAGLSGALIPVVLSQLGQDPAQASSIILTTVTDVVGFFSFLGIATLLAGLI